MFAADSHRPRLGERCRLAPHQLQPLPAPLSPGSRGALPGILRHPQGDGGWKLVPLHFARELYLAAKWRPGVGSLSIDSNQRTILELPENPQHGIYRSLWASGREAITLACLGLQERGLSTGSGAGSWAPERLGVPLTPVPGPEPRGQALASQSEGSARGFSVRCPSRASWERLSCGADAAPPSARSDSRPESWRFLSLLLLPRLSWAASETPASSSPGPGAPSLERGTNSVPEAVRPEGLLYGEKGKCNA